MTPAIDDLVAELKLPIAVLACHEHFLADVGKDLLEPAHAQLRDLFRRTKVRPKLRALVRDLGRQLGEEIDSARGAVLRWQSLVDEGHQVEPGKDGLAEVRALAQWTLDSKAQASGNDFPFDRPYLDLYDRCLTALRASDASDAFLRKAPPDKDVVAALRRLHRGLEPVDCQVPFSQVAEQLRRRASLFDELRAVLRLSTAVPGDETEQDLEQMHMRLDRLVASLRQRRPARGPAQDTREAIDLILEHLETHGHNIWGHVIQLPDSAGGNVRLVSRTNFLQPSPNWTEAIENGSSTACSTSRRMTSKDFSGSRVPRCHQPIAASSGPRRWTVASPPLHRVGPLGATADPASTQSNRILTP